MGKTDRKTHKNYHDRARNLEEFPTCGEGCISDLSCLKHLRVNDWGCKSSSSNVGMNGSLEGSFGRNVERGLINFPVNGRRDKSYEVWCICRVVKPCGRCGDNERKSEDRELTPTPENSDPSHLENSSNCSTPTPEAQEELTNGISENGEISDESDDTNEVFEVNGALDKTNREDKIAECCSGGDNCEKINCKSRASSKCGNDSLEKDNQLSEQELSDLQELFEKLNEIKENGNAALNMEHDGKVKVNGHMASVPETPTSVLDMPLSAMDSASVCSFDHFDFDTSSFCSLKSTDTMEQSDLADQLYLVQQMVMEMKTGFARAMEELSKIQYGDQTLQQQLADNKKECSNEITAVKTSVDELKVEVQRLNSQVQEISETQRNLQEKVESYQSDKLVLLEELERNGVISDQTRVRLSGGSTGETNNNVPEIPVGPMVHPYLNSLQNHHHRGHEDLYQSDSSLTAAVSRSLNLTQALGEKCLNLDFSTTSSDDEDNSRHSHSGSGHNKPIRRHRSFHREESARDIVEAEREYCAQIWSLLEDFMNPIRQEEIIGKREFNLLFPTYVPQMYEQHCIMLRKLEDRLKKWKYTGVVGDVFAKFTESQEGEGLVLYKDFINDFPAIIGTMNKWFTHSPHFRELMQSPCLANSPVLPLLLAPLQQVPKYSLLLKGLLKYTPADHPDRYYLESSLNRLKHFLNEMNDDLEHAMQVINSNNQPMTRPRDFGHCGHSKSSGSSTEANHLSRDSGIHSNEEDRERSPMSPNTTRRYLIQVLREKREREIYQGQGKQDGHPSTPRSRKELDYGSHPDLSHHQPGYQDGRVSPYLASLPQSKMFSSLSKLPLPRDKNKFSRPSKGPPINTNYLRPLTPQVFPTSTSAHSFESARRRDELAERAQRRPASAVEFAYSGQADKADHFYDILAHQAGLTVSPPHSSSSDKSRRDLQMSLQKLLAETNNADDYSDNEHDNPDGTTQVPSYHKQLLATKDKVMNQQGVGDYKRTFNDSPNVEDYGIYGDDDDDDANDEDTNKVRPMRLLPDTHRPKIMVPRWRQNASPQPPSYGRTVENMNKPQNSSNSEENLAASLAQSLLDGRSSNEPVSNGKEEKGDVVNRNVSSIPTGTNNLKRRFKSADTPKVSSSEPRRSLSDKLCPSVSGNTPLRPTDLKLTHNNSGASVSVNVESSEDDDKNPATTNMHRPNSVTKLSDVIAYTADCIDNKETKTDASDTDNVDTRARPASFSIGNASKENKGGKKSSLYDASKHLKVSSVDADCSSISNSDSETTSKPKPTTDFNISFAVSPNTIPVSKSPVNTESVVNYFQNRGQVTQDKTESSLDSPDKSNRVPTFISMDRTSTPVSENLFQTNMAKSKDSFSGFSKKESGRLVRGDNVKDEKSAAGQFDKVENKDSTEESKGETEGATKESILRAVDKLRLDLERQKQHSKERKFNKTSSLTPSSSVEPASPTSPTSPTSSGIQRHFNELSRYSKPDDTDPKPLILKTFSAAQKQNGDKQADNNMSSSDSDTRSSTDQPEQRHGMYRKAGQLKTPSKYPADMSASARQIQKLERSASPPGRTASPSGHSNDYEKFKSQVETTNISRPTKRGSSPHRGIKGVFAPIRSKSPTVASSSKERPKSTTGLPTRSAQLEVNGENVPLKSAMKDTKIPVLRKSSNPNNPLSKSSEDISKLKKKSAFKDQLKNIFGRKKKRSKLYSTTYDPDEAYNNHVTIDPEPSSFHRVDDDSLFKLTPERRANSTSQILQSYTFEDDDSFDDDPVSAV